MQTSASRTSQISVKILKSIGFLYRTKSQNNIITLFTRTIRGFFSITFTVI